MKARFPRSESAFHQNLTKEDREELLKLQSLREIPKSRYATQSCLTGLPGHRGRKVVYSHIEIYKMVEDIATDLREAGVRPQTVCAFALHNSIDSIVYFQALMWIGAIALPIDPGLSLEQIGAVLKETKAFTFVSALVDEDDQADDGLFQKLQRACAPLDIIHWYIARSTNRGVFLDRKGIRAGEAAAWAGGAGDFKSDPSEIAVRLVRVEDDDCLVFDIPHRSIASATREFSNTYELSAEMSTLQLFPLHSIEGLMCMLATMYSGGNTVIPAYGTLEPEAVLRHITEQAIKWFSSDPDTILGVYDEITKRPEVVDKIKLCFIRSLGKNIDSDTMRTVEPILRAPVLEGYGSAETCSLISANKDFDFRPGTFGKAVNGCDVVIVDSAGDKLQANLEGDIAVKGIHVCRGYLNNDYANEHSFVSVTDGDETKQYFLTGDKGSVSTDGFLKVTSLGQARRTRAEEAPVETFVESVHKVTELDNVSLQNEENQKVENLKNEMEEEVMRLEEERRLEELRLLQEREAEAIQATKDAENTEKAVESSEEGGEDSDEVIEEGRGAEYDGLVTKRSVSISARSIEDGLNSEMLDRIMERLDQIERNQRRLEEEIEAAHRREMERLRELFEKTENARAMNEEKQAVNVNMDEINSAVNAAAASAQSSSRDTAAAAQAAREAAEAAAKAAAVSQAQPELSSNVVEVADPSAIQKTVLVSLDEVESAMKMHPAVATARAFGRPDKKYGMEVFCAVNPKKGARVSEPWLKLHAQTVLPAAFVPKKFFYKADLTGTEGREELAKDTELQRMSHYAGFKSGTKVVKGPEWSPSQAKVV